MWGMDWIELAPDIDRWSAFVNAAMNIRFLKFGEFIDWLRTGYVLRKDCAPWIK